jgi:hypothetical protein
MLIVETSIFAALAIFFAILTYVLIKNNLLLGYAWLAPILCIFFIASAIIFGTKPTPKPKTEVPDVATI